MREYGKVFSRFWTTGDVVPLKNNDKLLALYLLTCEHANMIGCFRLPLQYVEADLRWEHHDCVTHLAALINAGFVMYDTTHKWVLIPKYLEWNPIENFNQGKAATKLIEGVPHDSAVYPVLIQALQPLQERFAKGFVQGLAKPFPKPTPEPVKQGYPNQEQEQEQEQEKEQEQEQELCGAKKQAPPAASSSRGTRLPDGFVITDEHSALARELGVDVKAAFDSFRDHFKGKAGADARKADWDATFRNWLRNQKRFERRPQQPAQPLSVTTPTEPAVTKITIPKDLKPETGRKAWDAVSDSLKRVVNPQVLERWVRPLRGLGVSGNVLYVGMPNADFECVNLNFGEAINTAVERLGLASIKFVDMRALSDV